MYNLSMFFYKDGIKYKEAEVENLKYAKDVDNAIAHLLTEEYECNINRSSVKYIYDTINNPRKEEYLDELHKIEYDNTMFFYDLKRNRYYSDHQYQKLKDVEEHVHIGVTKV